MIVYVVTDDRGHLKIGVTRDIRARLVGIQSGNPYPLRLLMWQEVRHAVELDQKILQAVKTYRMSGEWMQDHEVVREVLRKMLPQASDGSVPSPVDHSPRRTKTPQKLVRPRRTTYYPVPVEYRRKLGSIRRKLLAAIQTSTAPVPTQDLLYVSGIPPEIVRLVLVQIVAEGLARKDGRGYSAAFL